MSVLRWAGFGVCVITLMVPAVRADEVTDLIGQLHDKDPFVRCFAAEQLGALKDKRAIEPLLELMQNPRPQDAPDTPAGTVPSAADSPAAKVNAAKRASAGGDAYSPPGMTSTPEELKRHFAALQSRMMSDQKNALKALGQLRDKRAVPTLLKLLQDTRTRDMLKSDILEALGEIGDPSAYDAVAACAKADRSFTKSAAVSALGKLGDPRAAELLYQAMCEGIAVRKEAAQALRNLGGYEAVLYLNKARGSEEVFVRQEAEEMLQNLGPNHGLEPLLILLKDADAQVRSQAAQALAALNDPAVEMDLQQAMATLSPQDRRAVQATADQSSPSVVNSAAVTEVNVKIAAIEALGQFRDFRTVKPLLQQLTDPVNPPDVRRAAGKALAQYQNSALLRTFEAELYSRDKDRQTAAMASLGYLGTDEAVGLIRPATNDPFLKDEAFKALAQMDNPAVLPYLYEMLKSPFLRQEAMDAIVRINDPASAEQVAKILATETMSVDERLKIIEYLAASNNPAILPYLKEQATDAFVGEKVVDLLIAQDRPEIVEPLVSVLVVGRDDKSRQKALDKLVQMNAPDTLNRIVQTVLDLDKPDSGTAPRARSSIRRSAMLTHNDQLPDAIKRLAAPKDVDQLARLLPIAELQGGIANLLKQYNWQPTTTEQKICFYIATENWQACKDIGRPVIPYLLEKLRQSGSGPLATVLAQMNCAEAKPILLEKVSHWAISSEQLAVLQDAFGWRPVSLEDRLNVAASRGDRAEILALWRQDATIQQMIVARLNDSDDGSVESVVRLCIRLGKEEMVSPMIDRFMRIRDDFYAIRVANLFLGSGHDGLDRAARSWADAKGYSVIKTFMRTGGPWGQG